MAEIFQSKKAEKIEAVIFDWAGTTQDYGCFAPADAFVEVFRQWNVPLTIEEARIPMGVNKKVHIQKLLNEVDSVRNKFIDAYQRIPTEKDVEGMFKQFVPYQMSVLSKYADLIPGTVEVVEGLRKQGLKIGSTTGYTGEMMELILYESRLRGYVPDASVCSTGLTAVWDGSMLHYSQGKDGNISRPKPDMCLINAALLGVSDPACCVKVGDTLDDIYEGKNAGMWTIGLAMTGNEMGLNEEQVRQLKLHNPAELEARLNKARERLANAGANFVLNGIWDVPARIADLNRLLKEGYRP